MTDENLNTDASVDQAQQADSFSQNLDAAEQQAPEMEQPKPQGKYVSQDDVNSLISAEKKKAYEKGMRAANSQSSQQQPKQPSQALGQDGIDRIVDSRLNSKLAEMQKQNQEIIQRQQYDAAVSQVEGSLKLKMDSAREQIDGFDESLASVDNFSKFPGIKFAASQFEDGGKVLHYLSENPDKIAGIENIATLQSSDGNFNIEPTMKIFKRISDSIALNDNGKKSPKAPNPISQIQTNLRDGIGSGEPSFEEFRQKYTV